MSTMSSDRPWSASHRRTAFAGLAVAGLVASFAVSAGAPATASSAYPECRNGDLHVSLRDVNGAAGHNEGLVALRNISGHTCATAGHPGVAWVGRAGRQIGRAATRLPAMYLVVVLRPDQVALARLNMVDPGDYPASQCRVRTTQGLRVYVPDSTLAQFVPERYATCANRRDQMLQVGALRHRHGSS